MSITIGIIGNGFVGQATALLRCETVKVLIYDVDDKKCEPIGITMNDIVNICDIIFICVPTPMLSSDNPRTNTYIVESVIAQINVIKKKKHSIRETLKNSFKGGANREIHSEYCHVVVRSTVPIGFCTQNKVHHFPEFLTEKNWKKDFESATEWVIGVNDKVSQEHQREFKVNMIKLFHNAHMEGKISSYCTKFESTNTTELVKYARNAFLATKLSFCNEIADFAKRKGIEYEHVRNLFILDSRIGSAHTNVPGSDGRTGWGGTCLPKDCMSLLKQYEDSDLDGHVLKGVLRRNLKVDRKDKDWEKLIGRSITK